MEFYLNIKKISESIAISYNLNIGIFLYVYLLSFIPFYLGYILILYGTTRNLKWSDIFGFRFKNGLKWNKNAKIGLCVHLFGRIMPYAYIIIFGKNLSVWIYVVAVIAIIFPTIFFLKKIFMKFNSSDGGQNNITILKMNVVDNIEDSKRLWNIYNKTFEPLNKISPCRQSLDEIHFMEILNDSFVGKYVIDHKDDGIIGLGLITNDFKNTPWISEDYFKENFSEKYVNKLIFYFMGLAIDKKYRGNKYSIRLIEHIIDDLPDDSIMGFDHSKNINPLLHHFTKIVKQSAQINRNRIDQQHYHVVQKKT